MTIDELIGKNFLDSITWPDKLSAKVVQPGDAPRLYGYDVHRDLAQHYRWSELLFLSLTGELPEEALAPAIEVALIFLSSVSVAEAPGHAAVLAGLCGLVNSAAVSVVTMTLAEEARSFLEHYKALPKEAVMPSQQDEGIAELRQRLDERNISNIVLETRLGVLGAALSVLEQCGLSETSQLEAIWVITRLPVALAEARHQPMGKFVHYPTQLPTFKYQHARQKEIVS